MLCIVRTQIARRVAKHCTDGLPAVRWMRAREQHPSRDAARKHCLVVIRVLTAGVNFRVYAVDAWIFVCMRVKRIHTNIHTYIHTHIHTYIHTVRVCVGVCLYVHSASKNPMELKTFNVPDRTIAWFESKFILHMKQPVI